MEIEQIKKKLKTGELIRAGNKVYTLLEWSEIVDAIKKEEDFDLLQLTKKIAMNSLYGSLLNASFRFGDMRMGASTTASGRRITKFMLETINYLLTGTNDELAKSRVWIKKDGEIKPEIKYDFPDADHRVIIYGDTDSGYFLTNATNKEDAILIADGAADGVNDAFPIFMQKAFNCQPEFDGLIKAGREIVGRRGLFQAKKKYMIKVIDLEGMAVDKMKSQGSEIKKADTPKIIQVFLKETVDMILDGREYKDVETYVNAQRTLILKNPNNVFLLGVSKQVNNVEEKQAEIRNYEKTAAPKGWTVPGHVRAAVNYNTLLNIFEPGAKSIMSGDKILIYYVKPNENGFKSIAVPADLPRFPQWIIDNFQIDIKLTEQKMFENKLEKVFAAIGKDVPTLQSAHIRRVVEFF